MLIWSNKANSESWSFRKSLYLTTSTTPGARSRIDGAAGVKTLKTLKPETCLFYKIIVPLPTKLVHSMTRQKLNYPFCRRSETVVQEAWKQFFLKNPRIYLNWPFYDLKMTWNDLLTARWHEMPYFNPKMTWNDSFYPKTVFFWPKHDIFKMVECIFSLFFQTPKATTLFFQNPKATTLFFTLSHS